MESVQYALDTVFHESIGRNQIQLDQYDEIYNIPRLQYLQHTCNETLLYLQKKKYFIILLLHTTQGKVFLRHDWSSLFLPWWSVHHKEDFHEAVNRMTKDIFPNTPIYNIEPTLFVDNTFCHKNSAHSMHGIVYTIHIHEQDIMSIIQKWGFFSLSDELIEWVQKYWNKDILLYAQKNIVPSLQRNIYEDNQHDEIDINMATQGRYLVHNTIWKPLLKILGINKSFYIKRRIQQQCEWATKIIDVSCGEDNLVHKLSNDQERIVVWNDISRSQINLIRSPRKNLFFTNHSATQLPFKNNSFDISICKNTIHHMPNREKMLQLLHTLKKVSKKILLIEIENPLETWWLAKFLHHYWYRGFLKDAGNAYLDRKQYLTLIDHVFWETHKIEHGTFKTWQGNYFWSIICPQGEQ